MQVAGNQEEEALDGGVVDGMEESAEKGDRGQGPNARIVRKLQPGEYWLTVRHKAPAAIGSYSVGVKKRR